METLLCIFVETVTMLRNYLTDLAKLREKIRQCEKDVRPKRKNVESLIHSYSKISKRYTFSEVKN